MVTLRSAGRTACASYATAAAPNGERVLLAAGSLANAARWVLHRGPQPGTFYLASVACPFCERRWLGVGCGDAGLRLYARAPAAHSKTGNHVGTGGSTGEPQLLWRLAL